MAGVTGDLLRRHFGGPFVWGERDCCVSACNAFAELTGIDPMAPLRGRYRDRESAEALGWLPWLALHLGTRAGLAWRLPARARPGDIAVLTVDGRKALGLAIGDGRFAAKSPRGVAFLTRADGCWGLP